MSKIDEWLDECINGGDTFRARVVMCWYQASPRLRECAKIMLIGKAPDKEAIINEVWGEMDAEAACNETGQSGDDY